MSEWPGEAPGERSHRGSGPHGLPAGAAAGPGCHRCGAPPERRPPVRPVLLVHPLRPVSLPDAHRRLRILLVRTLLAAALLAATPAGGVLIASGDGTGNTSAPADDPGFAHVGVLDGLSGVYVGNRWMLTAWHVGEGTATLAGVDYAPVPGSRTRLVGPEGVPSDLALVKLLGDPGLPGLLLAEDPPPIGAPVVIAGRGRNRGAATTWNGHDGWLWGPGAAIRWGTNTVTDTDLLVLDTVSLVVDFAAPGTPEATVHEAQVATGDSGGALFWKDGSQWRLAGTLFARTLYDGQPTQTALYGNASVAADLAWYREQIEAVVQTPACSDGLDDDGDGLTDHPDDPGCDDAGDASERSPLLPCDDGVDNDGDGLADHPADPQCATPETGSEAPLVPLLGPWAGAGLAVGLGALGLAVLAGRPISRSP